MVKKGERRKNWFKERKQFDSTDFSGDNTSLSLPLLDMDSGEEEEESGEKLTEEIEG